VRLDQLQLLLLVYLSWIRLRLGYNLSHYTQEELENKKHNFELCESDYTVLCIDYTQNGIGSKKCGPQVSESYQLSEDRIKFNFFYKI